MNDPTQAQIEEAINNCYWRNAELGASVCSAELLPCIVAIENGKCPTLKELFEGQEKER